MATRRRVMIKILDERWWVPYGFGKQYEEVATRHIEYVRTGKPERLLQTLSDILALVGYEASAEAVSKWELRKRVEAQIYCGNVHARASDNVIRKCPRPDWMPEAWQGPERGEGVWAGPGPTSLS